MFKTILLVLGEHDPNHAAVDLAFRWASDANALLVALGIIDEAVVHPVEAVPLGAGQSKHNLDAARLAEQRQSVESCLSALAVRCANERIAFKPLEDFGRPAAEILLEAQRFDLIVMPRHAHFFHASTETGLGKALWDVVRASPRPVVSVSDQAARGEAVVIAYDGSLQAARALQSFEATGLAATRPVHVVSLAKDKIEAARRADRAVDFLAHHGIHATLHAESDEAHIAEHIMEYAHRLNAGLLVMGAFGKVRPMEFVLGSVTRSVLANCAIPLLLYH